MERKFIKQALSLNTNKVYPDIEKSHENSLGSLPNESEYLVKQDIKKSYPKPRRAISSEDSNPEDQELYK